MLKLDFFKLKKNIFQDYFTDEMAVAFFTEAVAWQKSKGYVVHHETHRKRFLYSPWVARNFVPRSVFSFFSSIVKLLRLNNHKIILAKNSF